MLGSRKSTPTRRALLTTGAAATLALAAGPAYADTRDRDTRARLRELEEQHGARVGAFAHNLATGATARYRASELFPMCSAFKTLAVAAVLRDLDRHGETLAKRIHYTKAEWTAAGGGSVTVKPENLAAGMAVEELCDAAIRFSDNLAANLLLRELGGPAAVTRLCRSLGDPTTRLDRWEPELNTAEPWRVEDTTTPAAIGRTYARLALGNALNDEDRTRLTTWLLGNTTSAKRFHAGLPADWTIADKTGTGSYGTANDVGIAWTPSGAPVVLAVLTTRSAPDALPVDALVAETAKALASAMA
ncbi:class A beta-lactamase [Streptomyces sp. NPDC058371]|uniref:class A beta-lactamase n=1 Tax=Streptomyces sp. NPDC058371 TaxID=3346463 RepID=UPI003667969C